MNQKTVYLPPQADVLDLSYADPVCQVLSATGELPNYDVITPGPDFFDVL
ncbi:MAG: hypothetical protein IK119_10385 [Bacteroidales bacterium]|nr:hypothetical protein [Bacteroidales bacterium]